jgi:hypothetical protein
MMISLNDISFIPIPIHILLPSSLHHARFELLMKIKNVKQKDCQQLIKIEKD